MSGLAEEEVDDSPAQLWLKRIGGAVLVVAAVAGGWFVVKDLIKPTKAPARQVARITIVPDTPPPPPPPPKEEKRPEPPKESPKEVKIEQPKQEQQPQPQQAEQLKMEGQGSDSGLAGLASGTVNQEYAGQKIGGDGTVGGGPNRLQYSVFTNALQRHLQEQLARNRKLRDADYRMVVKVWLGKGGNIERVEIANSTGNPDMDDTIRMALADVAAIRQSPPDDLPQPVRVRIANRGV